MKLFIRNRSQMLVSVKPEVFFQHRVSDALEEFIFSLLAKVLRC